MQFGNTENSYGFASRTLHWMTVLVIFSAFPLGVLANGQDLTTDDGIGRAFLLFSLHKTTGVLAFVLGITRLFWTISQPKPAPIHSERRVENFAAGTVHWMLTIALIVVPLAGWVSHSATSELAPIWWPFFQSLPFVPVDNELAERSAAIHWLFTKVFLAAVILHIAGALKHLVIDRDKVFVRMWRGTAAGPLDRKSQFLPTLAALSIWATALAAGLLLGLNQTEQSGESASEWPLAEAELILVNGSGTVLATAPTFGLLLVIDPNSREAEKGTLDLTVPLDALEGPASEKIASDVAFPLLQFLGTVEGTPPTLSASGPITTGDQVANVEFSLIVESNGARISGSAEIPGLTDAFLTIDAFARKP